MNKYWIGGTGNWSDKASWTDEADGTPYVFVVDSYSESNQDGASIIRADNTHSQGQSFTGDGGILNRAKFYVKRYGSPTGNAYAKIYAHTGTFGTDGTPTGSALATSDAFDVSTLNTSFQLITLTFSGAEKITLTDATNYFIVLDGSSTTSDGSNYLHLGNDSSSPSHSGNRTYVISTTFYASSTEDLIFYVYAEGLDIPTSSDNVFINEYSGFDSGGTVTIDNNSSVNNITANEIGHAFKIDLYAGKTLTVTGTPLLKGTSGKLITLDATEQPDPSNPVGCDSYSDSNYDGQYNPLGAYNEAGIYPSQGQSFTGNGGTLSSCKFYLKRHSSASGNAYAKIYAHTGTFGTDGTPTGSVLATSDAVAVSSSITTSFGLIEFTFSGANKITLTDTTKYCVVVNFEATSVLYMGIDESSPSHAGNFVSRGETESTWYDDNRYDACFYVYVDGLDTQHTLSKSSGTINCDYLDISNSNATGGATWYAGLNSENTENNDGWIFLEENAVNSKVAIKKELSGSFASSVRILQPTSVTFSSKAKIYKKNKLKTFTHFIGENSTGTISTSSETFVPTSAATSNPWLYLSGHFTSPTFKLAFDCYLGEGVDEIEVQLYNLTTSALVEDSLLTITSSGSYLSDNFLLTASCEYIVQARVSDGSGSIKILRPRIEITQEENIIKKTSFEVPLATSGLDFSSTTYVTAWSSNVKANKYVHNEEYFNGEVSCYLEAHFGSTGGRTNYVRLYKSNGSLAVEGSEITNNGSASRIRSSSFSLDDEGEYIIQTKSSGADESAVSNEIRLVFYQEDEDKITKTVKFIDLRQTIAQADVDSATFANIENAGETDSGVLVRRADFNGFVPALILQGVNIQETEGASQSDYSYRIYDEISDSQLGTEISSTPGHSAPSVYQSSVFSFNTENQFSLLMQGKKDSAEATDGIATNYGLFLILSEANVDVAVSAKAKISHSTNAINSYAEITRTIQGRLEIMWDGSSWGDETTFLISAKGHSKFSGRNGELVSDECDFELENTSERFSPDNTLSPLYSNLKPNVKIRFSVGVNGYYTRLFTGVIKSIMPDINSGIVNIHCFDNSYLITDRLAPETIYTNKKYHEIVQILGENADIDVADMSLETSLVTAEAVWFEDKKTHQLLSEIAIAERGRIFFDQSGNLAFWNKYHFETQAPVARITMDNWITNIEKGIEEQELRNRVVVISRPRKPDGVQVVWSNGDSVASSQYNTPLVWIPLRSHQNAFIELEDPAIDWQIPQPNFDYVANSQADGEGTDLTDNISIDSFVSYKKAVFLKVTNNGDTDAFLTEFNIRANPLKVYKWIRKLYNDNESIYKYGERETSIENDWIYSDEVAQSIARQEVEKHNAPEKRLTVDILGIPNLSTGDVVFCETKKGVFNVNVVDEIDWSVDFGGFIQKLKLSEKTVLSEDTSIDFSSGIATGVIAEKIVGLSSDSILSSKRVSAKVAVKAEVYRRIAAKVRIISS